jgi:hypothetical protein
MVTIDVSQQMLQALAEIGLGYGAVANVDGRGGRRAIPLPTDLLTLDEALEKPWI